MRLRIGCTPCIDVKFKKASALPGTAGRSPGC
ncbi:TPA_asm: UL6 uORF RNA *2 [Human alphaherpesvirus 1]|nr:TPA_asm: UL6 uORF RNA *2 [Human alphaherpesvirus 1]